MAEQERYREETCRLIMYIEQECGNMQCHNIHLLQMTLAWIQRKWIYFINSTHLGLRIE